ncbi:hypothetical protein [Nonomuraea pusilla]|uniref:Uncharacterized protein n=1 Tax=Nonomuraea pusilla TaxID=46177 RepID=A0A1H7RC51_9ACTN|nr:hypothetical protein [Nonomuraea pusilla]SEL57568.1 hypothetical protein SAMN05660976_02876 [Nonomuraea pusilla]
MSRIGWRAAIVSTLHSHARTRAYGAELLGREGVVVAVLRNGTAALVKLDGDLYELPGGVQRWLLQWDDLDLKEPIEIAPPPAYVTGVTKTGRSTQLHAVPPGITIALCSSPARPLPMCGWSVAFSTNASRACSTCVALINGS